MDTHLQVQPGYGNEKIRNRDLTNSDEIKIRMAGFHDWLIETGHIDVTARVIRGSGKNISSAFSHVSNDNLKDIQQHTKQINLGSYNYSGLAVDERVIKASVEATEEYGSSVSGARLLNGTTELHRIFEEKFASFIGVESAVTYTSGFTANTAAISCFCGENDIIFSDILNHKSIGEGIKLSKAKLFKYPHNDMNFLEKKFQEQEQSARKFIITDSIFSMDGDIADLRKLCELAEQYNAFIILDEAHSIGAYGPNLRGLAAELGLLSKIDIITGSLSKGLPGGSGGFVLCNKRAADALRFASSGYIFSGSLPPATLAALNKALDILLEDNSIGDKLFYNQAYLRKEFRNLGLNVPEGNTPIIPIIFNDDKLTYSLCRELHKKGVFVNPVRYPFVAKDAPRIRINATASLSEDDLKYSIEKFKEVLKDLEIASS